MLLSEADADSERIHTLTGGLRQELLADVADVVDVTALRGGELPSGARGLDAVMVGGLPVSLSSSEGLLAVVHTIRGWLSRGDGSTKTVRMEIDGDVLELSGATAHRRPQPAAVGLHVGVGRGAGERRGGPRRGRLGLAQ